jgi:endonuclease/exonuclease/phosphatase family metal-dependent hydrolase
LKKFFKITLCAILFTVTSLTVFFLWAVFVEYRPKTVELIDENINLQDVADEFVIMTWNIGYAGMNAEMDFVMDGGQQTRITKEQTQRNIQHIVAALDTMYADFFLLQEVDEKSKRSYRINQFGKIADAMPEYHLNRAYNFKTGFVPIPVTNPIGSVRSGLATLGKIAPVRAERYAFPNATPLPNRLFDLKRCFLVSEYKAPNNKKLHIINTHNSAFDSGEGRKKEMEYLREILENFYRQGAYVIAGGDWNQLPPDYPAEPTTPQYTPHRISQDLLPDGWQVVYDKSVETVRFANEPYIKGSTLTATVDFFLVSPNVEAVEIKGYALDFEHSDHNPVRARFRLNQED